MSIVLTRVDKDHAPQRQWCGAICTGIELVPVRRPVALVWSHCESARRLAGAQDFAAREVYTVRVLANTRDLLDKARALALAGD